jgi:hypothetical protein
MKILMGIAFLGILGALIFAGISMVRRDETPGRDSEPKNKRMAQALAWRVGISVTLFLLVLLGYKMGWIRPTGLPMA